MCWLCNTGWLYLRSALTIILIEVLVCVVVWFTRLVSPWAFLDAWWFMWGLRRFWRGRASIYCISDATIAIILRFVRFLEVTLSQALLVVILGLWHRRCVFFKATVALTRVFTFLSSFLRCSMARFIFFEGKFTVLIILKYLLVLLLRLILYGILFVLHLLSHRVLLVRCVCHKQHLLCLALLSSPLSEFHLSLVLLLSFALCLSLSTNSHLLLFFEGLLA